VHARTLLVRGVVSESRLRNSVGYRRSARADLRRLLRLQSLVNVLCCGALPTERLVSASLRGRQPAVLLGSSTAVTESEGVGPGVGRI